jgi:hypothetical protein
LKNIGYTFSAAFHPATVSLEVKYLSESVKEKKISCNIKNMTQFRPVSKQQQQRLRNML